jgi:beta-lactamase class A
MKGWMFALAGLVVGAIGGFFVGSGQKVATTEKVHETVAPTLAETRNSSGFQFINPLLECDNFTPSSLASHTSLRDKLISYSLQARSSGVVSHISVYYRDLNNGPWIGLNEKDNFSPASMLKVPIMMAVLKYSEGISGLLDKKFEVLSEDVDDFEPNIDDEMVQVGQKHSIRQLIERMIIFSDNTAKNLLLRILLNSDTNSQMWSSLGLSEPNTNTPPDFLSVKDYSSFFRILYNATYLSKENSELALEILSRTRFKSGIRAGIQNRATVSSKFGERGLLNSDEKQLHDCAIVYDGNSPYLLCIMTKGTDWDRQSTVIQEISKLVFENRK